MTYVYSLVTFVIIKKYIYLIFFFLEYVYIVVGSCDCQSQSECSKMPKIPECSLFVVRLFTQVSGSHPSILNPCNFDFFKRSYTWHHTACNLSRVTSFPQCNIFEIHSRRHVPQYLSIFHHVDVHFIHSPFEEHLSSLHVLMIIHKAAAKIPV